MNRYLLLLFIAVLTASGFSQSNETGINPGGTKEIKSIAGSKSPLIELAASALKAHGGDKLKNMSSLTVIGSVDITPSNFPQAIPATFVSIFAGEKYRFELNNPFQPIKQVYDGDQTYTNVQTGFSLPPLNRMGFPLIPKIGDENYVISALPGDNEIKKGFRITSPEGFYTDFYLDKKTGQIKKYDSSYVVNGNNLTTSVEISKFREVEGVLVPEKYSQRFDMGQLTVYAEFKAKEIIVNKVIADDVFVLIK